MADRLALLPLTGAGETHCIVCDHWVDCKFYRRTVHAADMRHPECLQAERDASGLRAVKEAAVAYLAADEAANIAVRSDALCYGSNTEDAIKASHVAFDALRAALKE